MRFKEISINELNSELDEVWVEFEFNGYNYKISNKGRVAGTRLGLLKERLTEDGYLNVTLGKYKRTSKTVHSLVAEYFLPKPITNESLEVNHKDFNRTNNNVSNLEWVTHKENINYSFKNISNSASQRQSGALNIKAKLSEQQVIEIRNKYESKSYNTKQLMNEYNVSQGTIYSIINYKTWKYLRTSTD